MNVTRDWLVAEVAEFPQCDFCDKNARYDAAMGSGPWAFMCHDHWKIHGSGKLGLGFGQQLVLAPKN
jgi:hypothetical protein